MHSLDTGRRFGSLLFGHIHLAIFWAMCRKVNSADVQTTSPDHHKSGFQAALVQVSHTPTAPTRVDRPHHLHKRGSPRLYVRRLWARSHSASILVARRSLSAFLVCV